MFKDIKKFIVDDQCKIYMAFDTVNINNYEKIIVMENSRISISSKKGNIIIKGENLLVKKLLDRELLIKGEILSIELER